MNVRVWQEQVIIPTYGIGVPEKNPVFLEKRVYQGSSGVVYPHPVIEKILDEKTDKGYIGCFLENEYLKVMILPELGGRVQMAFDKIKQRHFIYYQDVIKPALVGLTGPWISGGIEFNWPQHHRPSTFDPVDFMLEENEDGSATIWCSEVERMFRTKGMTGFTLYPGVAYLEIRVRLFNRTPYPQTFLWWANPAVHVNDNYQSVFPPDVHAVYDHGRRDVSEFPIARGTYYKVDYSAGVDISRYKNIPVPTSYMAVHSSYDFLGGYEHDTGGGVLHVADHHIAPGKKQWTWGNGDFGRAWDRNLTDSGGPYIELMCGVFTDNQPDFSWLMPYEERSFEQYFMPYHGLGVVKNATKDAFVNMEVNALQVQVRVGVTRRHGNACVELRDGDAVIFRTLCDLSPEAIFFATAMRAQKDRPDLLSVRVLRSDGVVLVSWRPERNEKQDPPPPAKPVLRPTEISGSDQLYLAGLHLEQYRHATYDAADYYEEALKRDPGDVRCNNAMGLRLLRRHQPERAEQYFRKAIERLTERNANPYDGEPYYNLGRALTMQSRYDEAFVSFAKAAWNAPLQDAVYLALAQLSARKGTYEAALGFAERSLTRNSRNHRCRHLITVLRRKLGRIDAASAMARESLLLDHFNVGCLFEEIMLKEGREPADIDAARKHLLSITRCNVHSHLEFALDYAAAGFYPEATALLSIGRGTDGSADPMAEYVLGYFASAQGESADARRHYAEGAKARPDCCFPHRWEEVLVLRDAQAVCPDDAMAPYYLGNLWYGSRQYGEAIACWEQSVALNDQFPTAWRNLGLAYFNKRQEPARALAAMERAFALDPSDARVLMELDQLYKRLGRAPSERLDQLEQHPSLVDQRDDLYLERATLRALQGDHAGALALLLRRRFHPWEGGEGKVTGAYVMCCLGLARAAIAAGRHAEALEHLKAAETYPANLGEGKLPGALENDLHYYCGRACEGVGMLVEAREHYRDATIGMREPASAYFYNDQRPDTIFYQGLAHRKLGDEQNAVERFATLVRFAEQHMQDAVTMDFFAVSLPDLLIWDEDLSKRNALNCSYLKALGLLGLGDAQGALELLGSVLEADPSHPGAVIHHALARVSGVTM